MDAMYSDEESQDEANYPLLTRDWTDLVRPDSLSQFTCDLCGQWNGIPGTECACKPKDCAPRLDCGDIGKQVIDE